MYTKTIVSLFALAATIISAAPESTLHHAKRQLRGPQGGPPQGGPPQRIDVGQANVDANPQDISVVIVDDVNNSGSTNFAFLINDVLLDSDIVAESGVFTEASCFFFGAQAQQDANGNIACDLDLPVGQGVSSVGGTAVVFDEPAQCMFCAFF